jgi:hypothetical protein
MERKMQKGVVSHGSDPTPQMLPSLAAAETPWDERKRRRQGGKTRFIP